MTSSTHIESTDTLVVGLGATGLSCVRHLARLGARCAVTDSRAEPPGLATLRGEFPNLPVRLGGLARDWIKSAHTLVVSPGVAVAEPPLAAAAARGAELIGDIELFARVADAPVVAITGSNGKSTVTTLVQEMALADGRTSLAGGNLGEPALALLDRGAELYVLELSSFQLETTHSLAPLVAVVLNISPDHMDRYPDLPSYAAAKERIYTLAEQRLFNRDDPAVRAMQGKPRAGDVSFGLDAPVGGEDFGLLQWQGESWLGCGDEPWIAAREIRIAGRHNRANALAALALGQMIGLSRPAMLDALRAFTGLRHRTQLVAEQDGVRWYNDSKGTNVGACAAALDGFADEPGGRTLLIAGGVCKDADFSELAEVISRTVSALILIGRDAAQIAALVDDRVPVTWAKDMRDAVRQAADLAQPGDRVLLSPACASFDMFNNFEQRGDAFCDAVREQIA